MSITKHTFFYCYSTTCDLTILNEHRDNMVYEYNQPKKELFTLNSWPHYAGSQSTFSRYIWSDYRSEVIEWRKYTLVYNVNSILACQIILFLKYMDTIVKLWLFPINKLRIRSVCFFTRRIFSNRLYFVPFVMRLRCRF